MSRHKYAQSREWSRWPVVEGRWYIYALHLEGEKEYRYVGSTRNVQYRYYQHLHEPTKGCKEWIDRNRPRVRIHVFKHVTSDHRGAELRKVNELKKKGHRLLNARDPRQWTKAERVAALEAYFDSC